MYPKSRVYQQPFNTANSIPTTNITPNGKGLNALPLERERGGKFSLAPSNQCVIGGSGRGRKAQNRNAQIGENEAQLFSFNDDLILYGEIPKERSMYGNINENIL